MPFIDDTHRKAPDKGVPGDRCYLHYKQLMEKWRANPRWTTIDQMLAELFPDENKRAFILAFLVFFGLHGMPYEVKKRDENGEV